MPIDFLRRTFANQIVSKILILLFLLIPSYLVWETNYTETKKMVDIKWAQMLTGGDQHGIYVTFKEAMSGEIPRGIKNGWLSVGYLSLMGFYHKISSLWTTPEIDTSYIFHGFIYSVLLALVSILFMYRVARHQSPNTNSVVIALTCALLWLLFFKLSAVLRFSYLPWSHYACGFIGMVFLWTCYEIFYTKKSSLYLLLGFSGCLFLFARRHEAIATFVAVAITFAYTVVRPLFLNLQSESLLSQLKKDFRSLLKNMVFIGAGVLVSLLFIKYYSNWMPMNSHYEQQKVTNSYVAEYLKIYPQMIPLRIVQTFVDPNYYSYGNPYGVQSIVDTTYFLEHFSMPMLFQIPILLFLLPAGLLGIYFFIKRKSWLTKNLEPAHISLLLGGLTFCVLTCGYLATAVWGGVHLKHGLVREFLFASLALLVGCGPALFASYPVSTKAKILLPLLGITFLPILLGQTVLANSKLYQLKSKHMAPIQSQYKCDDGKCNISFKYFFENGTEFSAPFNHIIVNQNCPLGIEGNPLALGEVGSTHMGPDFTFEVMKCAAAVNLEIYPLFTGYCGSGQPPLKFSMCPSRSVAPDCK